MYLRITLQLAEAFGDVNRWFCSQAHCRHVDDKEVLLTHYIRSGGAADFARRFEEAMGPTNRWYCSQHHRREIHEAPILWEYYSRHAVVRA